MIRPIRFALMLMLMFFAITALLQAQTITIDSLLDEMLHRQMIAKPANYLCLQASSYDRRSVKPDDPQWFANGDASQFVRQEKNGDRNEWVLMDVQGPGAVVRWWITAPHYKNSFYLYVDGATEPTFIGKSNEMIGGTLLADSPLSAERARGRNLYLPIPFAKSLKITCDNMPEQKNLYYQINYRLYPEGTKVESFSKAVHQQGVKKIAATNARLEKDFVIPSLLGKEKVSQSPFVIKQNTFRTEGPSSCSERLEFDGRKAIDLLQIKVEADDLPAALRHTLLVLEFDGQETVRCPLGDFFGSGIGVNPYRSWYTQVEENGTMTSLWFMPFNKKGTLYFETVAGKGANIQTALRLVELPADDVYLYFHCNWKQDRKIKALAGKGTKDWNYLGVTGRGTFVGDVLSLVNPVTEWWGEGDEKIFVDGESFPSHFGTGTEDYYGYAWCTPQFFQSPFHAQPRAEGPSNFGNVTNLRFRALDAIPFNSSFQCDMEVWHWAEADIDYAVATFWYGDEQAVPTNMPKALEVAKEAAAPVSWKTPLSIATGSFLVPELPQGKLSLQSMRQFQREGHTWNNSKQVWWTGTQLGWRLTLLTKCQQENPKSMTVGLTNAIDYGKVQFYLDGKKLGEELDLFIPKGVERQTVTFSLPKIAAGDHQVEIEITGKNEQSVGTMFGIDSIEFK